MKISPLPIYLLIFFICATWRDEAALAQEFMAGTVLSADIDKMEITLIPGFSGPSGSDERDTKSMTVRVSADSLVVNGRGERVFPGCVFPDGMVRLWGHTENGVLMVTDIRCFGGRGRGDPTGVRRRLQKMGPGYCPVGPGFHGGRQ